MYYISKALSETDARYINAEKLAYSLVITTRKLRAYFEAHPIKVLTDSLLKKILHKPDVSGHFLRWSIEIFSFDISFEDRRAIKAQALADFIAETTFQQQDPGVPLHPGKEEARSSRPLEKKVP